MFSSSAKASTGRQFATITVNGKATEVELDADGKSMIVPVGGGRTVRIPRGGKYTVTGSAKGALTVVPSEPEPAAEDENRVMAQKRRIVAEAAKRPPAPKNARESYLRARNRESVRMAHEQGFRCGFSEGQSKLLQAPLADRVTEADAEQLLELVMSMVLDNAELRAGYRVAVDMVDGGEAEVSVPAAPAPVADPTPTVADEERTLAELIADIEREVGDPVTFGAEAAERPVTVEPVIQLPEAVVMPQAPAQPVQVSPEATTPAAPRSIWNGSISCGLMNVPVKLFGATQDHGIDLHQVHGTDGGRISQRRICKDCGEEVAWGDIGKGHETEHGMVTVTGDELKALQTSGPKEFAVDKFVDASDIDPSLWADSYNVGVDKKAERQYALLRETLRSSGKVAVGTIRLRTSVSLAVIRVVEDRLVLNTLRWADEVRPAVEVPGQVDLTGAELDQAADLIEAMAGKFEHTSYTDPQQVALAELLESKVA